MRSKNTLIILSTVITVLLFCGVSFVFAQNKFTEPGTSTALPLPITTTNADQVIKGVVGLGVSQTSAIPSATTLFVNGITISRENEVVSNNADVFIDDTTFKLHGRETSPSSPKESFIEIGGVCDNGSKVCVKETANQPAVSIKNTAGIGLYGETAAGNFAGIYGQGDYGIQGVAGSSQAIALGGIACTTNATGECISYNTAALFEGSAKIVPGTGSFTGNGSNVYRVHSLYNLKDGATPDKGVAYQTFKGSATGVLETLVPSSALSNVVSIIAVESSTNPDAVDSVMSPAGNLGSVSFDANGLHLKSNDGSTVYFRIIVSYLTNPPA